MVQIADKQFSQLLNLNVTDEFRIKGVNPFEDVDIHDIILADTSSSPVTITILTSQILKGTLFIIKDGSGNASTNNVTVATEGSETIDGASTVDIIVDYGVIRLFVNGTNLLSW